LRPFCIAFNLLLIHFRLAFSHSIWYFRHFISFIEASVIRTMVLFSPLCAVRCHFLVTQTSFLSCRSLQFAHHDIQISSKKGVSLFLLSFPHCCLGPYLFVRAIFRILP
jgi:hypothetical protein